MQNLLNLKITKIFLITFCMLNFSPQKAHAMEYIYSAVENLLNKLFSNPQPQSQREEQQKIDTEVERPKKRARTQSPSPVHFDDESDVEMLNPQDPKIKLIQSIQQGDGWKCGYFSVFNCYQLAEILRETDPENLTETLNQLNLSNLKRKFVADLRRIFSRFQQLQELHQQKNQLSSLAIQDALTALFEAEQFEDLENISVIEMANFDSNILYPEYYVIKNIENFRECNIPQLIILHQNNHWTTWIITREGVWGTNSLQDYDPKINQTLIKIFNYFNYQLLPSFKSITQFIRQLKQTGPKEVEQIKRSACQKDFTKTQIQFLAQKYVKTLQV